MAWVQVIRGTISLLWERPSPPLLANVACCGPCEPGNSGWRMDLTLWNILPQDEIGSHAPDFPQELEDLVLSVGLGSQRENITLDVIDQLHIFHFLPPHLQLWFVFYCKFNVIFYIFMVSFQYCKSVTLWRDGQQTYLINKK